MFGSASKLLRHLPPRMVRILILSDAFLTIFPPWGWFAYCRWTGKLQSPIHFVPIYFRGLRFGVQHLMHSGGNTGLGMLNWSEDPLRRSRVKERNDYSPKGSCGTCQNCCSTHWLPENKRTDCPLLVAEGCSIYGGLWWDYFNCGSYPAKPEFVDSYGCPRFESLRIVS